MKGVPCLNSCVQDFCVHRLLDSSSSCSLLNPPLKFLPPGSWLHSVTLSFISQFLPRCSWWSSSLSFGCEDYFENILRETRKERQGWHWSLVSLVIPFMTCRLTTMERVLYLLPDFLVLLFWSTVTPSVTSLSGHKRVNPTSVSRCVCLLFSHECSSSLKDLCWENRYLSGTHTMITRSERKDSPKGIQ